MQSTIFARLPRGEWSCLRSRSTGRSWPQAPEVHVQLRSLALDCFIPNRDSMSWRLVYSSHVETVCLQSNHRCWLHSAEDDSLAKQSRARRLRSLATLLHIPWGSSLSDIADMLPVHLRSLCSTAPYQFIASQHPVPASACRREMFSCSSSRERPPQTRPTFRHDKDLSFFRTFCSL